MDWKSRLTPEQIAAAERGYRRWHGTLPPCGISHLHPCNPCLAEDWDGKLRCLTCGMKQVLEIQSCYARFV